MPMGTYMYGHEPMGRMEDYIKSNLYGYKVGKHCQLDRKYNYQGDGALSMPVGDCFDYGH